MKNLWLYKFVLVGLFVVTLSGCKIVMEYRMDDCDPTTTIVDSSDTANDAALKHGSGNTDGLSAQYSFDSSSDDGYVVCANRWFRGEGYNADPYNSWYAARYYIEAPDHDDISPLASGSGLGSGLGEMTLTGWFKTSKSNGTIISKAGDSSNSREYRVFLEGGTLKITFWNQYGSPVTFDIASSVADNAWHAFAVTAKISGSFFSGNNLQVKKYLDGDFNGTETSQGFTYCAHTSGNLFIGAMNWGNGSITDYFDGYIDELLMTDEVQGQNDLKDAYLNMKAHKNGDGSSRSCACVLSPLVDYRMDESEWDGTVGEVIDSSGNDFHATANNGPTTASVSPAIPGNPGTCSYGVFDGVDDYVALPGSYPDLMSDFTITAWIRTKDNTRSGQRILIDDPNNTQGFGFSLGDGGTGRVRFFSRSTRPIILDTPNVVANNTWYFVAAVADISNNTKRIYVYDQAGNQLAAVFGAYTGSWGADVGDASIGGENDSSGESGPNFHFEGNIDELRVHDGALTAVEIQAVLNEKRLCIRPAAEYRFDNCSETNTIIDDSGNGFDGIVLNGPLSIESGKICNGAGFDGVDDYISIDDSNLFDNTDKLTIAGWINPQDIRVSPPTGNARGIVSKRNTYSSEVAYGIFFYSARRDGRIYVDLDTTNNRFASNAIIPEDSWTHFAVVFDGNLAADERAKLYINGVLDKTARESSTTIPDYNSNLYIGNLYTGLSQLKVYKGLLDEIRVIPEALSQADITALYSETRSGCQLCGGIDHIRIEHTGVGLTCQDSDITLRACSDAACTSESVDPVTVTMTPASSSPPTWIGGDTYTFTGNQTVQLRQTTSGPMTLGLTNSNPVPANSYTCYDSGVAGDCKIVFYDSGFLFDVPDLTSCQTSPTVSIQAVRTDDTTQTCIADGGFAGTNKTVNFWSTYTNPATGTEQVALSGTNVTTSSPGTGIPLAFDANATASFTVSYPDAGQMQLNARYDGVGAEEAGLVMLGTDSFTARPVGLCVYSDDANADCASGDGSCSAFRKVDEAFNLKVKGVCWESSGDTDFCSGNSTTQNFRLNSIPMTHNLIAPTAGGSSGSIGVSSIDIAAADNGEHVISNQTVSEVGVFTFTATPPNYFGSSLPAATSTNIGRFTPDHFTTSITNQGKFQDSCSGFTYSGQSFSYDPSNHPEMLITAVGSGGSTTVNYRDDFVKLTVPATQITMPAVTSDTSNLGADGSTLLNLSWVSAASSLVANDNGTLNFTLGADQFTYTREANALVAPFNSDIQLSVTSITDADSIAATDLPRSFAPAATEIRYGRMQLQNAYGPETLPLTIPVVTEFYDGSAFTLNALDSCTPYDSLHLQFSNYQGNLISGDTTATGSGTLLSGSGSNLSLSAPGVGHEGSVDLELDLSQGTGLDLEWLQPDGNNPTAKATFGIFKGNQRLIYRRESVW